MKSISLRIAEELGIREQQVDATVALLDEGATVPFIARYRKEVTGSLDDSQLRTLEERLRYLRELEDRRATILKSIDEQGKLTDELRASIEDADTKNRLEDLYLPYKPKRRTKAQIAREAGLEPLADALYDDPTLDPEATAAGYLNAEAGIDDAKAALEGARHILMERFAEDAELLGSLRDFIWREGKLKVTVVEGKETEGAKFRDYFDHVEPLKKIPSHRALAILRGRNEGILSYGIVVGDEDDDRRQPHPAEQRIAAHWRIRDNGRAADRWLSEVVRWTWRVKLSTQIETDLMAQVREAAEAEAIQVFAANLKDLLLAAPAGPRPTLGLDPGLRTGVKVAIIDGTGQVVGHGAIFPHAPQNKWDPAIEQLAAWCRQHRIELVAIGNGTASRETEKLVADLCKRYPELKLSRIVVNEAGASVYSASEFASRELPDLDVTIRGAVSIARRLQDPLAELVKIEPKSIGVGQYQHDVSQVQLSRSLDAVVEDCVNAVGVDLNTASVPLLARVSGLNQGIAQNIVDYRNQNGLFRNRRQLLKVPRLGERTFEQAAGFLRIVGGDNPLDRSSVHPEAYGVVEAIAARNNRRVEDIIGDSQFLRGLDPKDYVTERFGLPTVRDIIAELEKPGRDPRPEFRFASFEEGVETLNDLKPGMVLEGAVTNVTNFGAFVDIGVHQDGLVHISALSHTFVKDPRDVVKAGDIVRVKVMEVDIPRKRIGLSMRLDDQPGEKTEGSGGRRGGRRESGGRAAAGQKAPQGAMAGALAQALASARKGGR
ncbi:Tex family protein [Marinobacter lutaoensis]|uniref:RNA-binding transcriptional accessory protein n=1 Tax=Marinobacter lutaoensis TaxID=135739 RepID=A0A1V2DVS1_9GAMM|nr:Tex family protein [Marinobacter lutaoensis]MBI43403.1 RNA-binding transcriptional accessory protein [Oceanospirillales bacterium]NVD36641.1 RNA-binding transcriptional accessory protein [Marinobacter lutaoensis]ONF44803.1 RNA-binding transcriptional accessory protein [Marinobacter lutaoensis]|tara:strand:+ start:3104 stop:5425 length:2322 start_codon:yes stop_codon:yes gene_type:complete